MTLVEEPLALPAAEHASRFGDDAPSDLRARTGRGTLVNAGFMVAASALTLLQGVVIARLLPTSVLGLWGLLMAGFMTLLMLGSVGIDDKFVQQDDSDQQRAFEIAFTLQMALGVVFVVVILVGMPLFALAYGRSEIVGPGLALAAVIPALALQMPLWVHYRRMDFMRQRMLQIIDPVVTFVATIGLVLAGLGVWGLVLGAMIGSWTATIFMVRSSPYPLRLRWDRAAAREYKRFSWPLFVAAMSTVLLIQVPVVISSRLLGVTAVAGIALATSISRFTTKVDELVTQSLYPAICAVKDRSDLLFESFWKSNRLALLWAAPFGAAAALFSGDFVHYVVGEKWRFAVPLIAAFGLTAAINQIAFNWTAYFRALGNTRPVAVGNVIDLVAVMAIAVPLLVTTGVTGFGIGMGFATLIAVCVRLWYLRGIFPGLPLVQHIARGMGPTLPGVACILILRSFTSAARGPGRVLLEISVYAVAVIACTYLAERPLLRESVGYLRRRRVAASPAT